MSVPSFKNTDCSFKAFRILAENESRSKNSYSIFRKKIRISRSAECVLRISADTYYNLYIDGSFINRGPVRHPEFSYEYDELTVALGEGEHLLAVLVHHIGVECATHRLGEKMLWLEMDTPDGCIVTDESWKAAECDGYLDSAEPMSHFGFREICDMRLYPTGWQQPDFSDDSWKNARILGAVSEGIHKNYKKRSLKLFNYVALNGQTVDRGSFTEGDEETADFWKKVSRRLRASGTDGGDGSYLVADFGVSLSGTAVIHYENAEDGCELIVSYDDMLNTDGYIDNCRAFGFSDKFILKGGCGNVTTAMARGFRYVMADVSGKCNITAITAVKEEYPYSECRPFVSSDGKLNKLFDQSTLTQRICTIDGFTDCVTRERVLWLGDAYMDCLGTYYSEPDRGLVLDTIYQHAYSQMPNGSLRAYTSSDLAPDWILMTSYNMLWLNMLCDYVLFSGDSDSVRPLLPTAKRLINYLCSQRNEQGIIDTARGGDGFWDWGFSEDEGLLLMSNAYFIHTVERLHAHPLFSSLISDVLYRETDELRRKCFEIFYDPSSGTFFDAVRPDGERSLRSQTANCLAILSGICPDELKSAVVSAVFDSNNLGEMAVGEWSNGERTVKPDRTKINPVSSMYGAMFVCRSLFDCGFDKEALRVLREVWEPFNDLPTLPELRKNGVNNTMCHGWSGAPAFLLPMYVFGIKPVLDGWKTVEFAPPEIDLGEIASVKGTVMTPYGQLKAQWTSLGGVIKLYAEIPKGIKMVMKVRGKSFTCLEGSITKYVLNGYKEES